MNVLCKPKLRAAAAAVAVALVGFVLLAVQFTASSFSATSSSQSNTASAAAIWAPENTAAPSISGTAQEGQTLTVANGTWTEAAIYTYQWRQCDSTGANCADIASATSQTYTPVSGDVGHTLRAVVTATNSVGAGKATTAATSAVVIAAPTNTALPSVTGTVQEGRTLTGTNGSWTRSPTGYAYRWQRCDSAGANCADITGATSTTYSLTTADIGQKVRFRVSATNAGGTTTASSVTTAAVGAAAPVNTAAPTITGTAQQAKTLTGSDGTWTSSVSVALTRQWLRCDSSGASCAPISGATNATYTLTAADATSTVRFRVTATNSDAYGDSSSATSGATAVVKRNYKGQVLFDNPSVFYTFDNVSGSTIPDDAGNGRAGSFSGGTSTVPGVWAGSTAAQFTGSNYVQMPANVLSGSSGMTFEGWVSEDCCAGRLWQRIFDMGAAAGQSFWTTTDYGNAPGWLGVSESGSSNSYSVLAPWQGMNTWVYLVVVSSPGQTAIYINGALAASTGGGRVPSDLPNDANNWLGRSEYPDPLFIGRMDEVAVYNYALSAAQISQHYALAGS